MFTRLFLTVFLTMCIPGPAGAQTATLTRDPQALALAQQSFIALGGALPSDSVASGTLTLVEGSTTETGTVRILTRGVNQSAEQITTTDSRRTLTYSRGQTLEIRDGTAKKISLELASSSQTPYFPVVLLAWALNSPDAVLQYAGREILEGVDTYHVRVWNTFSSNPDLQYLAEFSVKDLWFDTRTALPIKMSFYRRPGGASESRFAVEARFSNYRNLGGILYPFHVEESLNGTPWADITIGSVVFNAGLTDADFAVQ